MSYKIRNYTKWFLYAGLMLIGAGALVVVGCDTGMEVAGESSSEPLSATPYDEIAEKQYEALRFLDTYVEERVDRLGKRPERAQMRALVLEAQSEWLAWEGYGSEEIAGFNEQLAPHLSAPTARDDGQSLPALLTKQGFSQAQQRYIGRLLTEVEKAQSSIAFRGRIHEVLGDVRRTLSEEEAGVLIHISARMEGIGRFLHEKSPAIFTFNTADDREYPSLAARKVADGFKPRCERGPKSIWEMFKWRNLTRELAAGVSYGCAGGGFAGAFFATPQAGCVFGASVGAYGWGYMYWLDLEYAYRENLREWCDECFNYPDSPRNDVGECRREFGTSQYPPPLPESHRESAQ
jgi:hypothetical protein